ncbi:MAG TPA: hypothetical protein PLB92_00120 [Rhodoglobus sp.]|nr:hypothetical protein [Rhodoglobus sp.]
MTGTPQEQLEIVLALCAERRVDAHTLFCTVLTGYAESNFRAEAKHPTDATYGVFQQNPRWWPNARNGTRAQCGDFLDRFARIDRTGDPVVDCWQVQNWTVKGAPTPKTDMAGFLKLANTRNYTNRLPAIPGIISSGRLP